MQNAVFNNNKIFVVCSVLLGINPSKSTKIMKSKGAKTRSGVHEGVLAFIREFAVFDVLD
jgi:hypothetical protein